MTQGQRTRCEKGPEEPSPLGGSGNGPRRANVTYHGIAIPNDRIAEFCLRHRILRLSFFGSILRDDFRPESDIDVLVEFEPGATPGFGFFGIQEELTQILGRNVDLNTPAFLSRYFRDEVMQEAQVLYDAA